MKKHVTCLAESARTVWRRVLGGPLIADIPEELSACEFDCKRDRCTHGEWATCERRRSVAAEIGMVGRSGSEGGGKQPEREIESES